MIPSTKLITLSKSIFPCWPLFVAETTFQFFEFCCGGWFIFVCSIFLVSVVIFCVVFNLLYLLISSFIFCCCISSLALLVLEMVRDRFSSSFRSLSVGLIDQTLSCMLGLVFLSKLVFKFCLVEVFRLFLKISAMFFCVFSFFNNFLHLFALLDYISRI